MTTVFSKYRMILSIGAAAGIGVISYCCDPVHTRLYPPCPFKWLTGFDCPGCGNARALHALLHGDLLGAVHQNLLLLPSLLLLALWFFIRWTGKGGRLWNRFGKPYWYVLVVCLFWLLRNIPAEPFSWLHSYPSTTLDAARS
jgi:Protein of unknown function (DUF2752)